MKHLFRFSVVSFCLLLVALSQYGECYLVREEGKFFFKPKPCPKPGEAKGPRDQVWCFICNKFDPACLSKITTTTPKPEPDPTKQPITTHKTDPTTSTYSTSPSDTTTTSSSTTQSDPTTTSSSTTQSDPTTTSSSTS